MGPPPEMKAKMQRMMVTAAVIAFLVGFALAALIFAVL
jgi:hypothetical protein